MLGHLVIEHCALSLKVIYKAFLLGRHTWELCNSTFLSTCWLNRRDNFDAFIWDNLQPSSKEPRLQFVQCLSFLLLSFHQLGFFIICIVLLNVNVDMRLIQIFRMILKCWNIGPCTCVRIEPFWSLGAIKFFVDVVKVYRTCSCIVTLANWVIFWIINHFDCIYLMWSSCW